MFLGIPVTELTASVLLAITVLMILTGRLVPRIALKDKTDESDRWRAAYETEREARTVSDQQTGDLLEAQKTSHAMIVAIFENIEAAKQSRQDREM